MSRIVAPFRTSDELHVAGLTLKFEGGVTEHDVTASQARRLRAQGFTVVDFEPESAPASIALAPGEDGKPPRNASKSDWVEYAVLHGHQEGSLEELTRDQIISLFE